MTEVRDAVMRRWLTSDILDAGKADLGHEASGAPAQQSGATEWGHETRVMKKRFGRFDRELNIVFPDDNNRLEFQVKARKARSPSPKGRSVTVERV